MTTVITPFCASRPEKPGYLPSDAKALAPWLEALEQPAAKALNVCAITQRYRFYDGANRKDGSALLLTRSSPKGEVSALDPAAFDVTSQEHHHYHTLTGYIANLRTPDNIVQDFMDVSASGQWLFVLPDLLLMQSNNIYSDLRSSEQFSGKIAESIWTRSACARLRFPYPTSNHHKLRLMTSISNALEVMKSYRREVIADFEAEGFQIGPVTLDSLNSDLSR
jgi:hypothetical protein